MICLFRRWRAIGLVLLVCALAACLPWLFPEAVLPPLAKWLDVGEVPAPADYVLMLPGEYNSRPFVAAAIVTSGLARAALVLESAPSPDVQAGLLPPDHEVVTEVLKHRGVSDEQIVPLATPSASTFGDASAVGHFLRSKPDARVIIVTNDYHTRRARWTFQKVLGPQMKQVVFASAPNDQFAADQWWRREEGFLAIVSEYVKLIAYWIRYGTFAYWFFAGVVAVVLGILWRHLSRSGLARRITDQSADSNLPAPRSPLPPPPSPLPAPSSALSAPRSLPPAPPGWRRTLDRACHVLRYYRWSQLASRAARVAVARARPWCNVPTSERTPALRHSDELLQVAQARLQRQRQNGGSVRGGGVLCGEFQFLNTCRRLALPEQWDQAAAADLPRLWRFHLHYHDFLLDIASQAAESGDKAWEIVLGWIEAVGSARRVTLDDAWHPYCISKRIQAWTLLWQLHRPSEAFHATILKSLQVQAAFLQRHLEWDLRGNHLLENLRALLIAGAFLDATEADNWLATASRQLVKELDEQILPHGEHFERSPGYHAQMLELVLDIRDVTCALNPALSARCAVTARRMTQFLESILLPGGQIPQFGDSCLADAPPAQLLIQRTGKTSPETRSAEEPSTLTVGEYWTYRNGNDCLVFDAGSVGADHLPAHAHADLLNLVISIDGHPLLVDSGVHDYEDGKMRQYCRSTAAHNTLEVDGFDQCDMWSRFRMGYRGRPTPLETGAADQWQWARACHNAYRRQGVPLVGRWIACRPDGPLFVVDWLEGRGRHEFTSRLHLHPEVQLEQVEKQRVALRVGTRSLLLQALSDGQLSIESGWYCREMGLREPAPVVTFRSQGELPAACGWQLAEAGNQVPASLGRAPDGTLILNTGAKSILPTKNEPFAESSHHAPP